MSAEVEFQKSLFARLNGAVNITLKTDDEPSIVPVLDDVPDNQVEPFIRIGETTMLDWDTDDSIGREGTVTIHSWSKYRGYLQVKEMMDEVKELLHYQTLNVVGQKVVLVAQEFSQVMGDSDGLTRHGVQRFRILMEGT